MIFKIEDGEKKIFLHTEGLPKPQILKVIQDLQEIMNDSYRIVMSPEHIDGEAIWQSVQSAEPGIVTEEGGVEPYDPEEDDLHYQEEEAAADLLNDDEIQLAAEYNRMAEVIDRATIERQEEKSAREEEAEAERLEAERRNAERVLIQEELEENLRESDEDLAEMLDKLHQGGAIRGSDYRISDDGLRILYKCYYVCPACGTKSKRYVFRAQRTTSCHECKKRMMIKPSLIDEEFPTLDKFNNIFVAGEWMRPGESREEVEKELQRI